ncbi:MAG: hypothetical protein ACKOBV_04235 [Candidatus Kapaibacterium sp.]
MRTSLSYAVLKERHRAERDTWPTTVSLRIHRALSWLQRAEQEAGDPDAAFIFYWIAFNAAYAREIEEGKVVTGEQGRYDAFIRMLVSTDRKKRIHAMVFEEFSDALKNLIGNKYVLAEYWQHHAAGTPDVDWETALQNDIRKAHGAVHHGEVYTYTRLVLSRLYVLRNQIVHGSATWNSSANRAQTQDAAQVMRSFVPLMIDIMMDDPDQDWGEPLYPVQY